MSFSRAATLPSLWLRLTRMAKVDSLGIPTYLLNHPFVHTSISPPSSHWPASVLVRHNHRIDRQIASRKWHAAQIGPAWPQAVIPVISLTEDRLLIGAGGKLIVHPLTPSNRRTRGEKSQYGARTIEKERVYAVTKKADGSRGDIVGIAPLTDGQVIVAQFDGTVQRLSLDGSAAPTGPGQSVQPRSTAHYSSAKREAGTKAAIHTLAHDGDTFLTTTSSPNPCAYIYLARSPWKDPVRLSFPTTEPRAWSSLITTSSGYLAPSVMLGLSSNISIYDLPTVSTSSSYNAAMIKQTPVRTLTGPDPPSRSSAYDLHLPPAGSAHHPALLLSAWFDSHLRLHDLRAPQSEAVTEFSDPWTWADGSAMYSSAWFGEYGIAGGGARHGTVCLFDVRYPKKGWSVFSPQGKGSPVYDLVGEGGRLWGVTEKRAFVLAFDGSGAAADSGGEGGGGEQGLLSDQLMQELRTSRTAKYRGGSRGRDAVNGWTKRGGRWGWTVRYDEDDGRGTGYEHSQRGVDLFDGLPLV